MKKKIIIGSSLVVITVILVAGCLLWARKRDITPRFQNMIGQAQSISVRYYQTLTDVASPVERPLSSTEVKILQSLRFEPMPPHEIGECHCRWNPIFTITNKDKTQHEFGVGCTLTIDSDGCLPPGDHPLTKESKEILRQWFKDIGIDSNK